MPAEQWIACSAGHGAKGRRLYDWTRAKLAVPAAAGMARWLLVRRRRSDGELAFSACYGPAGTSLVGLVRVAGTRWAVEEGFEQAKGEVGLDHYEVRKWPGWYRHMERHEALWDRVEVRDLRRRLVAAGRLKLGAA